MSTPYALGCQLIRILLRFAVVSKPLSLLSKVWLRHSRIQSHLRTFRFDGVIDGGANIGEFAHLVRDVLPRAHLVCVEPHPDCADRLRRIGFEVVPYALWHSSGTLTLSQPAAQSTSCTVLPTSAPKSSWAVEGIRLDELPIRGNRILVKLDLQGAEVEAVRGMDKLWPRCEALLLEVSIGASGSYEVIRQLLKQKGYSEYSTVNELESMGRVAEADKLWVRSELLRSLED